MKTPASSKKIIATVPEIKFAKYKPTIMAATSILTTLSTEPMFFFIVIVFNYDTKLQCSKTVVGDKGHISEILFLPREINLSFSICFKTLLAASRLIPNSSASC